MIPYQFCRWNKFEFITRKTGACGPTLEECEKYYDANVRQLLEFSVPKPGYQAIRIPKTGKYMVILTAPGVQTNISKSYGMGFSAEFDFKAGYNIVVVLGQVGTRHGSLD